MFNNKMSNYNVYTYEITTNDYNEEIKSPVLFKTVPMFISLLNHADLATNDVNILDSTYMAITNDNTLQRGMVVNNQYEITYVLQNGRDIFLTLKEVQNG